MLVCYTADELPGLGLDSPKPGSMEHGACGLLHRGKPGPQICGWFFSHFRKAHYRE